MLPSIKRSVIRPIAGLICAFLLFLACSEESNAPTPPGLADPTAELLEARGCKQWWADGADSVDTCLDCLEYTYSGDATLQLRHINAGFNCVPGEITADITLQDSLIIIEEHESESSADCLCLFDIDYRFENLRPRVYTIRVVELYLRDGDEPLECILDLSAPVSGQHCVERSGYPWCLETYFDNGALVSVTGCKFGAGSLWPWGQECMEYTFSDNGTLDLLHVNAVFNCCPDTITGRIAVEPSYELTTITITEHEGTNGCRCLCPYDLAYRVPDLLPGMYRIVTVEEHAGVPSPGFISLDFIVDLSSPTSGIYCGP